MKRGIALIFGIIILTSLVAAQVSQSPQISVTLLNQDPDPVEQGDIVEARFKIENPGGETTNDITIELLPKYPFTLYTGEAARNIGKLRAGQTGADAVIVDYKLRVDSAAIEGDNEVELQVKTNGVVIYSYTSNEFEIDVQDYTAPDLKVYIRENTVMTPRTKGTMTIEVANVDVTDVQFLQFTLLPSEDYQLISSSNYVYMGDIDSDDTESEDFEIFVKEATDGTVSVPVNIVYQDSNENKFEQKEELSFKVYSSEELAKYGIVEKSYTKYVIIILVVAGIIWYFWRKRKKNK